MTVEITTLANGLRIATDTMREAESVVVGAWVGVGTRHEPWDANGVAHLTEHMMFKGTRTRSAYALSTAIEKHGGSMNAHTTREETAYYARVLPEKTERAVDIIADMLQHSAFSPKELDRERQVIIQEIGRDLDTPEEHAYDLLHLQAFPGQKIGRPILGSAAVIERMPRSAVTSYVKRHYRAGAMVLAAAGRIDHKDFVEMVKKRFSRLPSGKPPKTPRARIKSGGKLAQKDIEQLHVILGFAGPGIHSSLIYATQLLSVLLGGSSASRLFQKVREQRGLVYTISSGHIAFSDTGLFQIYAGTDPKRVGELIPVIGRELRDVMKNITPSELARAKAQLRAGILMGRENVMQRADALGHQLLVFNRVIPPEEMLRKVLAVSKKETQGMAAQLFRKAPIVTALGPLGQLGDYRTIAKQLSGAA